MPKKYQKDDVLKRAKDAMDKMVQNARNQRNEEDRKYLVSTIGADLATILVPLLEEIASNARLSRDDVSSLINQIKTEIAKVQIEMPEMKMPDIKIPEFKIPTPVVNYTPPAIRIPDIKMPDEMNISGWVNLMTNGKMVGYNNPLPVELRDSNGNPIKLFENLTSIIGGGGGGHGKADFLTIKGFSASAYADYLNADNRLRVSVETGGGGLTDTELRAAHLDVQQVSGAIDSINLLQVGGNAVVVGSGYQDNALRVVNATDATTSVNITNTSIAVTATDLDIRDLTDTTDSVRVYQLSGARWSTEATQSGTWNIGTVTTVTGITNSVAASIVDSGGIGYSGSNPVPITIISGSLTSTVAVGPTVADAADDGSAPLKGGGIARTANPTAVAANDMVTSTHDDVGRQVMRPIQVRDLIQTAYVQLTTGTETTLLAGASAILHDLIFVMGSNNSDAAVTVDLRSSTAGTVMMTIQIPANGTAGISSPVPILQQTEAQAWTADMGDITGTTVSLTALFTKEV